MARPCHRRRWPRALVGGGRGAWAGVWAWADVRAGARASSVARGLACWLACWLAASAVAAASTPAAGVTGPSPSSGSAKATATATATATAHTSHPVPASRHRQAAQRQARLSPADPALRAAYQRACAAAAAPASAALAVQALQLAEAGHRRERAQPRPDPARLLQAVVLRGCAAYHATRLQPGASYPVWLHTRLSIDAVLPAATGFAAQARATTADGAVAPSRITFSRGLHHACFVLTDPAGRAACTLVDTHPHGDRLNGWAEAHEGPLVATFAGRVSPGVVELPAIETRDFPVFANVATWTTPAPGQGKR